MLRNFMGSPRTPQQQTQNPPVAPQGGRALRLVAHDDKGRFYIDPEAVAALKKIKGPLAVVSVCGRARQGKSFILNQLLGRSNGFVVGPTHRPCTKGLWMWSSPVKRSAPDGTDYHLLLLDTEGIESYDQTGQYSTQIFSLAVLLSSLFVFNQMGGIDEAALDNLALVTEMTKHIRVKAEAGSRSVSAHELGQYAPAFIWLLRDFYLDLTEEGRKITPKDYLEQALQPMPGSSKAIVAKNEIRDSIRALFPNRDCCALVRPLNNERELQRLDQIPMEKLRPEFRSGLEALTRTVFDRARPKRMGSAVLTGPILAALTQSYLEAINAGAVPTIATSWQGVEEQQCRLALDAGHEAYAVLFDKTTKADEVALRAAHKKALEGALEAFSQEAIGTGTLRQQFEARLQTSLEQQFEEHKERVWVEAELRCAQALSSMEARLQAMAAKPEATLDQLLKALDAMLAEYEATASGPAKWPRLGAFLHASLRGAFQTLVQASAQRLNARIGEAQSQQRVLQESLAEARKQLDAARSDASEWRKRADLAAQQHASTQSSNAALEKRLAAQQRQLDGAVREAELARERTKALEDKQSASASAASKEKAELLRQVEGAQRQLRQCQLEAAEWRRKQEMAVAESREQREQAQAQLQRERQQGLERQEGVLRRKEAELEQVQLQHKHELEQISKLTSTMRDTETELQSIRQALSGARAEVQALHVSATAAKNQASSAELELAAARSAQAKTESELQRALQAARQSESAKVAAELQARREVEQARQRNELLEQNLQDLKGSLQDKAADLEGRQKQAETLTRSAEARAEAAESLRLAAEEEKDRLLEQQQLAETLIGSLRARAESAEGLVKAKEAALEDLQAAQAESTGVVAKLQETEAVALAEVRDLEKQREQLQKQVESLTAELETVRREGSVKPAQTTPASTQRRRYKRQRSEQVQDGAMAMDEEVMEDGNESKRQRQGNESETGSHVAGSEAPSEARTPAKRKAEEGVEQGSVMESGGGDKYKNMTKLDLKQRITAAGFGHEMLSLRNPTKGDLVKLYEKHVS